MKASEQRVRHLTQVLSTGNASEREWAAYALGMIRQRAPATEEALMTALLDDDAAVRRAAIAALIALDDDRDPEPILNAVRAFRRPAAGSRVTAEDVVEYHLAPLKKADLVGLLVEALDFADDRLRIGAIHGLSHRREADATTALLSVLERDPSRDVRAQAALALAHHGTRAISPLIQSSTRDEVTVRSASLTALGALTPIDRSILPTLIRALRDPEPSPRRAARAALWESGEYGRGAIVETIRGGRLRDRAAALRALLAFEARRALVANLKLIGRMRHSA